MVLSGMSTMSQVVENLEIVESANAGKLGPADQALVGRIREQYNARTTIPCTECAYCMPCPNDVNIPVNFQLFNYAHTFDDLGRGPLPLQVRAEGERAGGRLHRLRHLRRAVPAAHSDFRVDAEGGGAA